MRISLEVSDFLGSRWNRQRMPPSAKILVCCGYLITYWQCEASVEINWTSCSNFIVPCNRLNQSKSWVLNAFLSWDLHNWHINMHEMPWKWQNRMGKMVMCAEIKAVSRRTPELPLSPGRMVTLDRPRNRQGGSCRPLLTVYCRPHGSQVQLWPLAVFTGVHHSVFLSYTVKQSRRVIGLLGVLLTGFLAGDGTGMGCRNIANSVCRGKRGEEEGKWTDWIVCPMRENGSHVTLYHSCVPCKCVSSVPFLTFQLPFPRPLPLQPSEHCLQWLRPGNSLLF